MKSQELKIHNLPEKRIANQVIEARPYSLLILVFAICLFLLYLEMPVIYLSFLMIISLAVMSLLPSTILIEFYNDHLILHNRSGNGCMIVYYDEVVSWSYSRGLKEDELSIELIDESIEKIEAFSRNRFETVMNLYLKDKKKVLK